MKPFVRTLLTSISTAAVIAFSASGWAQTNSTGSQAATTLTAADRVRVSEGYGDAALTFEPNQGQAPSNAKFITRAQGLSVLLGDHEAFLSTRGNDGLGSRHAASVRMTFPGASFQNEPAAFDQQEGTSNYLFGNDPTKWHTSIPNYGRVAYSGIYPGIDLVFYGNHRRLEHDFVVAPGADYRKIHVHLGGAEKLSVGIDGALKVATAAGMISFDAPEIYQQAKNGKVLVAGRYIVTGRNEFAFEVGTYDRMLPLVIDPVLSYSTYLAGSNTDYATAIAVDSRGAAYITGYTSSPDFPTKYAEQPTCAGDCSYDVFVTKLNLTGSAIAYSTFIGGTAYDQANAISVDANGNAAVVGFTTSYDFPQKNGMTVVIGAGFSHGFVFSLAPSGATLNFSTFLGGISSDMATGVASDVFGNVHVSGWTTSVNFPITPGHQIGPAPAYQADVFAMKFSSKGKLAFSTLIGGTSSNYSGTFPTSVGYPISIAADSQGNSVLFGTAYDGFPTTAGAFQENFPGTYANSTFLARLNSSGSAIASATYLGGTGGDTAIDLALDGSDDIFVTGTTGSLDFPTTAGVFQEHLANSGGLATFITKVDPSLSSLTYSTYLGGTSNFYGSGVIAAALAVDNLGNVAIAGNTNQGDFPLVNPFISTPAVSVFGNGDTGFLSVLNTTGSALTFSTFLRGSVGATTSGVAFDSTGNTYIAGTTLDPDFPTTSKAFQKSIPAPPYPQQHAFATKISLSTPNAGACLSASALYFGAITVGQTSSESEKITNCGTIDLSIGSASISNPVFAITSNNCGSLAPGAVCTIQIKYTPVTPGSNDTGNLLVNDNAPISPQTVQLNGFAATASIILYSSGITAPDEVVGHTTGPLLIEALTYGSVGLHITSVVATGDFQAVNQCPATLYPGDACFLGVTFTPTAQGIRTGTLYIYDDAPGSPQTLPLTGNGLVAYTKPVIDSIYPGAAEMGSGPLYIQISGQNFFAATTLTVNGTPITIQQGSFGYMQATIPGTFLSKVGNLAIQVVNPAPGGGASAPVDFPVFQRLKLGVADAVYEPFTRKFYASLPASAPNNPNSLVTVDPFTGMIGTPIPIGSDPGALGISSDGMTLYVGLNGDHTIVPFNVATQSIDTPISLGSDPQRGVLDAADIQVQPGKPGTLVASLKASSYPDGVALIRNGNVVTQFLNTAPSEVAVGGLRFARPNDVFGWTVNYFGQPGLFHFVVSYKGLLQAPGITGIFGTGPFDSDGKKLLDANGQVYDIATGTVLATIPDISNYDSSSSVLTDSTSGRTFFLHGDISVYSTNTLEKVGSIGADGGYGTPNRLQKWGPDGLAYLVPGDNYGTFDFIRLHSALLLPSVGPNPVPVASTLAPASVSTGGPNFVLTVNGSHFTRGAVVTWNGQNRTTIWVSATKLLVDIPAADIATAKTAKIVVVNPGPGGGKSVALNLPVLSN